MPKPGELAGLSAELREKISPCPFSFEWSSPSQGKHLILCGDWNRQGKRTSRTLQNEDGHPIKRSARQLTTEQRLSALGAATRLVTHYLEGSAAKQRKKRLAEPHSSLLRRQRKELFQLIRNREGGSGVKSKHLRHARSLFEWLDEQNCILDAATATKWAGEGVKRNTDNYADRLRVAQWACDINNITWKLADNKRPKKPSVKRPFVDKMVGKDLSELFPLIKDPEAAAFLKAVAATGCRPSEVLCFDWREWDESGRQNRIEGYSRKKKKSFMSLPHPVAWIKDLDIDILTSHFEREELLSEDEEISERLTRHYSRLLKLVQKDLREAGYEARPTWTCFRHLRTIRGAIDGIDRRIDAAAQAHSEKMATSVYLQHGLKAQVLAEANRIARMPTKAS